MITASDLSAWSFCPRQVYYQRVLGIKPAKKDVMVKGTIKHKIFEELVKSYKKSKKLNVGKTINEVLSRYTGDLDAFGIDAASFTKDLDWSFGILADKISKNEFIIPEFCEEWLESEELGMKARVDVIFDDSGEWVVGDLKTNTSDFLGTKMQIGAGALLFEKHKKVEVKRIKIISHVNWMEKDIHLTDELRRQILSTRDEINSMIKSGEMPPKCDNQNKCQKCDFLESRCKPNGESDQEPGTRNKSLLERIFG